MRQRSTFTALVATVACGVGAVAPAYAASYEVTDLSDVPMNCNLQTDLPATFQGIADGAFYGEEYDLTFNLQVEAPAEVKPGADFVYRISPGFIGLANPLDIVVGTLDIGYMGQTALQLNEPTVGTVNDVQFAGGQAGAQLSRAGGLVRVDGGSNTIGWSPDDASNWQRGGLEGATADGLIGVDVPDLYFRMTAPMEEGAEISPSITVNDAESFANNSFLSLYAEVPDAPVVGEARALARCSPASEVELPVVKVSAAAPELEEPDLPDSLQGAKQGEELPADVRPGVANESALSDRNIIYLLSGIIVGLVALGGVFAWFAGNRDGIYQGLIDMLERAWH